MEKIVDALADDVATPKALSILSELVDTVTAVPTKHREHFMTTLGKLDELFGLNLVEQKDIAQEQKDLITERTTAKQAGTFKKADDIRDQLLKQNLELLDTPYGTRWKRKNI